MCYKVNNIQYFQPRLVTWLTSLKKSPDGWNLCVRLTTDLLTLGRYKYLTDPGLTANNDKPMLRNFTYVVLVCNLLTKVNYLLHGNVKKN